MYFLYQPFFNCCLAVILISSFLGANLPASTAAFIVNVGTIVSFPLNNSDKAYLAQYEADIPESAKDTPATLLKLVSTGPGHNMLI